MGGSNQSAGGPRAMPAVKIGDSFMQAAPEPSGTVVFMGAGASVPFGLPLTGDILRLIVGRCAPDAERPLFPGHDQKKLVEALKAALLALYPGLKLDAPDPRLPDITNVLSLFDHMLLNESHAAPQFGRDALRDGRRLLERAVMEVLIGSDLAPIADVKHEAPQHENEMRELSGIIVSDITAAQQAVLDEFIRWLKATAARGPLTIVTTNYDVTVENEIFKHPEFAPQSIDFGFDWRNPFTELLEPRPEKPSLRFYKLHGSFNWLRCDLCGQVYVNPYELIAYLSFSDKQVWANTCTCGSFPLRHVIVAPSTVRDVRDPHLLNTWRCATEALRTAEEWIMIGYSLPAEDLAIRSMLQRAHGARGLVHVPGVPLEKQAVRDGPRLTIVQKGNGARAAYEDLFPQIRYLGGGLEELIRSYARVP